MSDRRVETTERLFTRRDFLQTTGLSVGAATLLARTRAEAQPKKGGIVRLVFSDGNSGDSLLATKMPNAWTPVMFLTMYDPITRLDNGFQPRPGLAQSWETTNDATPGRSTCGKASSSTTVRPSPPRTSPIR